MFRLKSMHSIITTSIWGSGAYTTPKVSDPQMVYVLCIIISMCGPYIWQWAMNAAASGWGSWYGALWQIESHRRSVEGVMSVVWSGQRSVEGVMSVVWSGQRCCISWSEHVWGHNQAECQSVSTGSSHIPYSVCVGSQPGRVSISVNR